MESLLKNGNVKRSVVKFPENPQRDRLLQAIFELILTENSYVRDLQLVVEVGFFIGFS